MKKIVKKPLIVLAVGVLLLIGSSVGATRAAVIYQNSAQEVDFRTANVSVQLLEGTSMDDLEALNNKVEGVLNFPGISGNIQIGKKYDESICVRNNSEKYNQYVRVKVRRYWGKTVDEVLEKDPTLDPHLINLSIADGWFKNEAESTPEMDVYYYINPVVAEEGKNTVQFIDGITIDDTVTRVVNKEPVVGEDNVTISGEIKDVYVYDNASFYVELEVDAVQSHNAADAIYGAWGVNVECDAIDDGVITKIEGKATR